jgi:glycosyltransferase involved in cell wall biosynthesis
MLECTKNKYWSQLSNNSRAMNYSTISVVIPVRNAEAIIGRCLEAVFSQSYKPWEVIVVDGHSTDRTVEIASKFPTRIVHENYGTVGGARQVGLENSKGEYVAFTDADCIPSRDWLENLIKEFSEDSMGVGGGVKNIGEGVWGKSIALTADTFLGSANSVQGRVFKEKRAVRSISGCNSMYRKNDLMEIGGFNVKLSVNEETELNERLSKKGELLYAPEAVILHDQERGLKAFSKRIYQFGYGRGRLRLWDLQCVPPAIALFLLLSLALTYWIFVGSLLSYGFILVIMGFKFGIRENTVSYIATVPVVYLVEHLSYSIGFWRGLLHL